MANPKQVSRAMEIKIKQALYEALKESAQLVEATAAENCPVDDGNLRASITHEVDPSKLTATVFTNVKYACVLNAKSQVFLPKTKLSKRITNCEGEYVLSKDGKEHKVLKMLKTSTKGLKEIDCVSIKIRKGRNPLMVTPDHLILTYDKKSVVWKRADELKTGDLVFTPRPYNYKGKTKILKCSCGNEREVDIWNKNKYCSQKCYHKDTYHNRAFGKRWTMPLSWRLKRSGKGNSQWIDGRSFIPYPPEFNTLLKQQIRKRDKFTCQICKIHEKDMVEKLSIHHKDSNKYNNQPENLISLCRPCHGKVTTGKYDCELPEIDFKKFNTIPILKIEKYTIKRSNNGKGKIPNKYDLCVEGENSFVVCGVLIHNSFVEYGTSLMIAAHGEHDPKNPVRQWEAKRKRGGGPNQILPFLRPALDSNVENIKKIFGKHINKIKK